MSSKRYTDEYKAEAVWAAAGFTDTPFGCDDEAGGGKWQKERLLVSSSSRQ